MKLNPTKCVFGVSSGKFLGYMVTQRGIEANSKKIKALVDMRSRRSHKKVHVLIGKVTILNHVIGIRANLLYNMYLSE